jgi:hypothetical protein
VSLSINHKLEEYRSGSFYDSIKPIVRDVSDGMQ